MSPWLESVAVASVGFLAFLLGRRFSKLPKPYWLIGYFIPLGLVLLYCLAMFQPRLALVPPISWMMIGRNRFVFFNFAAVMLLATPMSKLPQKRNRIVVCALPTNAIRVDPCFQRRQIAAIKSRREKRHD